MFYKIIEETSFWLRNLILPFLTVLVILIGIIFIFKSKLLHLKSMNVLDETSKKATTISSELENEVTEDGFDIEKENEDNKKDNSDTIINKYHNQSLIQSHISFWFSIICAGLGFLIIISSVFIYDNNASYPGIVAGAIIDAVSALVFYQSNKARKQMTEFFDKLRTDKKFIEALRMCECIEDKKIKDELRVKLSLHFAGYKSSNADVDEIKI